MCRLVPPSAPSSPLLKSPQINAAVQLPLAARQKRQQVSVRNLTEDARAELQKPIYRALLMRRQQHRLDQQVPISAISFVASAVLAVPSTCSCESFCDCPPLLRFVGVNSALHRQINNSIVHAEPRRQQQMLPPMRGLLKGCAEQNALGALAAAGHAFSQVRAIVICSLIVGGDETQAGAAETRAFPCSACRNYLARVHEFVCARHTDSQLLNLSCVSLRTSAGDDQPEDKHRSCRESQPQHTVTLECVAGWSTDFCEESIVVE